MQTISNVLADVEDWAGLAGWLNLSRTRIQAKCQPESNGVKHDCYRRTLVRQCCDQYVSREKVVEEIAQVLEEKMNNNLRAQQLRELRFGECRI